MISRRVHIVCIGDSTTAGTHEFLSPLEAPPDGEGNRQSQYAYWIMQLQNGKYPIGESTGRDPMRFCLGSNVTHLEKPGYVIILAGVNDVYQGITLDDIKSNLKSMYMEAIAQNTVPVAATILPYNSSELEGMEIHKLNRWIKETANRLRIPFADTNLAVADSENRDRLRGSPDGLHPDVSGYRLMATVLTQAIEQHLKSIERTE